MAASARDDTVAGAVVIPFERALERRRREAPRPDRVVALVFEDGTVRVPGAEPKEGDSGKPFDTGQVSGDGWILWWQRRAFE
jgi:hypothetical protein